MKKATCFFLGLMIGIITVSVVLDSAHRYGKYPVKKELRDTVFDTIPYYYPVVVDSVVLRYKDVKLPVSKPDTIIARHDTIVVRDSVTVPIPITQKVYKDSAYTAYVSGFMQNLDSLKVYQRTVTNTTIQYVPSKPKRWGLGIQAGMGMTPQKIGPYIGIGISYNLLLW